MADNQHLIDHLINTTILHTEAIITAFQWCDRKLFVPEKLASLAYADHPLPIGENQTISQPSIVATMLELLFPQKGDRILHIGSGSGWSTSLLAHIVGKEGFVEGIERIPFLIEYSRQNLHKVHIENASIELENPLALGKPHFFYDRILVSARASKMPESLLGQLKRGGILVIPIGVSLSRVTKQEDGTIDTYEIPGISLQEDNSIHEYEIPGFSFGPLIEPD